MARRVLQPVDPDVGDDERAELGPPRLSDLHCECDIARHNREQAERLAAEDGPASRDGNEPDLAWQSDAEDVRTTGGLQMPMWRVAESDVWVLRVRIRDLDEAVVGFGFMGTNRETPSPLPRRRRLLAWPARAMTRALAEMTDFAITAGTLAPTILVGVACGRVPGEDILGVCCRIYWRP